MNKDIKLKKSSSGDTLYRVFIYVALITLAVTIIVPVAWGVHGIRQAEQKRALRQP